MPDIPAEKRRMATLIGKLMIDSDFREHFHDDPDSAAKELRLKLTPETKKKLVQLNTEMLAGKLGQGGAALHCEVASSIGYA
ncbi:MAG: Os1348 family NHLP clan protein [Magnetococcus sp. DMHC-8]